MVSKIKRKKKEREIWIERSTGRCGYLKQWTKILLYRNRKRIIQIYYIYLYYSKIYLFKKIAREEEENKREKVNKLKKKFWTGYKY